jgi:hypothetical protein
VQRGEPGRRRLVAHLVNVKLALDLLARRGPLGAGRDRILALARRAADGALEVLGLRRPPRAPDPER